MKKQPVASFISLLERQVNLVTDNNCSKKEKKSSCCDKISRKGRYCKKCPAIKG